MIISRCLGYTYLILETMSDELISEDRIGARRLLAVSGMYKYWIKKSWLIPHNIVNFKSEDIETGNKLNIFYKANKAMKDAVSLCKKPAARNIHNNEIIITDCEKIIFNGIENMLEGTGAYIKLLYEGGDYSKQSVCMACGTSTDNEPCPVCGGGKNQIVKWWEL